MWTEGMEDWACYGESIGACGCAVWLWGSGAWSLGKCKGFRKVSVLVLEGCVRFPVGLKASSWCCFRLLMRVPSGPLCVSWLSPRKEMMRLWLLVSQADPLVRAPQRRDIQPEAPCHADGLQLHQPVSGFIWMNAHICVLMGCVQDWMPWVQCPAAVAKLQEGFFPLFPHSHPQPFSILVTWLLYTPDSLVGFVHSLNDY